MAAVSGADGGYMDLMTCEQAAHVILEAGGASGEVMGIITFPSRARHVPFLLCVRACVRARR